MIFDWEIGYYDKRRRPLKGKDIRVPDLKLRKLIGQVRLKGTLWYLCYWKYEEYDLCRWIPGVSQRTLKNRPLEHQRLHLDIETAFLNIVIDECTKMNTTFYLVREKEGSKIVLKWKKWNDLLTSTITEYCERKKTRKNDHKKDNGETFTSKTDIIPDERDVEEGQEKGRLRERPIINKKRIHKEQDQMQAETDGEEEKDKKQKRGPLSLGKREAPYTLPDQESVRKTFCTNELKTPSTEESTTTNDLSENHNIFKTVQNLSERLECNFLENKKDLAWMMENLVENKRNLANLQSSLSSVNSIVQSIEPNHERMTTSLLQEIREIESYNHALMDAFYFDTQEDFRALTRKTCDTQAQMDAFCSDIQEEIRAFTRKTRDNDEETENQGKKENPGLTRFQEKRAVRTLIRIKRKIEALTEGHKHNEQEINEALNEQKSTMKQFMADQQKVIVDTVKQSLTERETGFQNIQTMVSQQSIAMNNLDFKINSIQTLQNGQLQNDHTLFTQNEMILGYLRSLSDQMIEQSARIDSGRQIAGEDIPGRVSADTPFGRLRNLLELAVSCIPSITPSTVNTKENYAQVILGMPTNRAYGVDEIHEATKRRKIMAHPDKFPEMRELAHEIFVRIGQASDFLHLFLQKRLGVATVKHEAK